MFYVARIKRNTGFLIDFWAFTLVVLNIFISALLFPFAKAIENELSTGAAQSSIADKVDYAFTVFCTGYVCMWGGKYIHTLVNKRRNPNAPRIWLLARPVLNVFKTRVLITILFVIFTPFFLYIAYQDFHSSNIFDVRATLGESDVDRPLYNLAVSMYPILTGYLGALYLSTKKRKALIGFIAMLGVSFIFSSRSTAFTALSQFLFIYIAINRNSVGWLKVFALGAILGVIVIIFGLLRQGGSEVGQQAIFASVLYGNTFSDLRDFAWFLSAWDKELLWGKTYLAGMFSFVPSGLSEFRNTWGLGKVTTRMTGLTGAFHGGLRITIFGESYINFGILGVVLFSTTFGYLLQSINKCIMALIRLHRIIDAYAMMLMIILIMSLMITSSFFSIYVIFVPMMFLASFITRNRSNRKKEPMLQS